MAMVVRANKKLRRPRRPHLHLRLGGHPLRGRLQPLLPRPRRERLRRRPDLLPGPRLAGHLRPRLPRRPAHREQMENFRRELRDGRRAVVLSAPLADARLLGVPHGLDGPGPDHGHLPGPVQPLPARTAACAIPRTARSGPSSATARPTSPRRSAPSPSPRASSSTT